MSNLDAFYIFIFFFITIIFIVTVALHLMDNPYYGQLPKKTVTIEEPIKIKKGKVLEFRRKAWYSSTKRGKNDRE